MEHAPRFYVAELPEAEEMKAAATPLMLTVTNPLEEECTIQLQDCAAVETKHGAEPSAEIPGSNSLPTRHQSDDGKIVSNGKITMPDGAAIGELKIGPKSAFGGDVGSLGTDIEEDSSGLVVVRIGNRVTINLLLKSKIEKKDGNQVSCGIRCKMTTASNPDPVVFTVYLTFSI